MSKLIAASEIPDWLERHGYEPVTRQYVNKALSLGWIATADQVDIGGRIFRWVRAEDVREYADKHRTKNP